MTDFGQDGEDDRALLRRYTEAGRQGEEAFRELVERYSGLVYGTAMRGMGNAEWAGDATQNVFAALASKAAVLVRDEIPSVGGWLHRAATFECKRVLRDQMNRQRREAMICNELTSKSVDTLAHAAVWNEIRPHLDEAMEKLPDRDRDVLLLHYFEGLKFGEIAKRLGIGAAAAQKRGKRALEKLARSLRSRSGAVSSVVLASGLATELARSAPLSLVTRITASVATRGGSGLATSSSANALLTAMTTTGKTISTTVIALVILGATIGAGYLIGESSRSNSPHEREDPNRAGARSASGSHSGNPAAAAVEGEKDSKTVAQKYLAYLKGLMVQRKDLIASAQAAQGAGASPAEMSEFLKKMEGLKIAAEAEGENLRRGDLEELLVLLQATEDPQVKAIGLQAMFGAWAKIDPREALMMARERAPESELLAFRGWGTVDAMAALTEQKKVAAGDRQQGRQALRAIFEGWLSVDPRAMITAFQELSFDEQKAVTNVFRRGIKQESVRGPMVAAIAEVSDERLRADMMQEAGARWAEFAPVAAFEWFDSIEFENPRLALPTARVMFASAVRHGEMEAGVDWLWPKLPPDQKAGFLAQSIGRDWMLRDPSAALAWMEKNGIENRDLDAAILTP